MSEDGDSSGRSPAKSGVLGAPNFLNAYFHHNQRGYNNAYLNCNTNDSYSQSHIRTVDVFSDSHRGGIIPALRSNPFPNGKGNPLYSGGGDGDCSFFPPPPPQQTGGSMGSGLGCKEPLMKKKRGRPRKYGNDVLISSMRSDKDKRGGGKKAQMAALGSAGQGFTPHIMQIATGEDVFEKILAFLQHGPRVVCVLSAKGAISNVTLTKKTYKGQFEIHSLSGAFLSTEDGGMPIGGLSVCFAGPDGNIMGGAVPGCLMAAGPVQVLVGTFLVDSHKNIAGTGNGEISSGTLTASISELPPPRAVLQSMTKAFGNSSAGQKGHSDQNTGNHSYAQHIQVLNIMSSHPMTWAQPQFEAQTRSNPKEMMTGAGIKDQVNAYQYDEDEDEDHVDN